MLQSRSKIYKYFKAFADAHQTIERIGFEFEEQLENFAGEDKEYPILFVSPLDSPTLENRGLREIGFRIHCLDIIQVSDRSNVPNILNKTDLILYDFLQFFNQNGDSEIYVQGQPMIIPINNHLTDYTAGHYVDVLIQSKTSNSCGAPMVGYTPPPSGECDDGTVNVNKSDGTLIEAVTVPSGGIENYKVADSIITVNTNEVTENVKATDGKNFNLIDQIGRAVPVDSVSGDDVTLATKSGSMTYKTGQTVLVVAGDDSTTQRGAGADWWNLSHPNFFGHTKRFTGTTGGYYEETDGTYYDKEGVETTNALAFPEDIVLDHSQFDIETGEVPGIRRTIDNNSNTDYSENETYVNGLTTASWSRFAIPNIDELWRWAHKSNQGATLDRCLSYEPLASVNGGIGGVGNGSFRYWSSTFASDGDCKVLTNNYALVEKFNPSSSSSFRSLAIRIFNISEL